METIYNYTEASSIKKSDTGSNLFLAHYNESYEEGKAPCFFWGKLKEPYPIARSLLNLSKVVSANFMPSSASLRDPVITAGGEKLRLEAFSSCCSVYAKVDILPNAIEGEFLQQGTTHVDFNTEMIAALSQVGKEEAVFLSVGKKEFVLQKGNQKTVEKKVSLPLRWIKGMTTVQILSAAMKPVFEFNKLQMQLLFRSIPKGNVKGDYYLSLRGAKPVLSPIKRTNGVCIGGIHRLRLAESMLSLASGLSVYAMKGDAAIAFQFHLKAVRFTLMLSRSHWRGFSGEGSSLKNLVEDLPQEWLEKLDTYAKVNEEFTAEDALFKEIKESDFSSVATRLSAMGLLGYDLVDETYYYRKLPFKLSRIESLNPRYKNALKIIRKKAYDLVQLDAAHTEARIKGSGVTHTVIIRPSQARCTCTWFAEHQNSRGECKHILATKILKNNSSKQLEALLKEVEL
ncbi:MAG: Unknown protein [uncultured Aureispira sp.]|uniref:SWIM-type domain-containing protein n=1 Tax=uncultured Aureispira sp. TaxID=1331704 RepID=A0A6S6UKB2_9BACT|nr:MAG: Unknown protein [uncultured Aureispira sp.]